jgi:hypothetical protein
MYVIQMPGIERGNPEKGSFELNVRPSQVAPPKLP